MIIVLDTSAAVQMLLKKEKSDAFSAELNAASWVIAPDLFVSEISNVFWKYHRFGAISRDECSQLTEDGLSMIDDFAGCKGLWKEAQNEAIKNACAVYDMFYAVLARRNAATLMTNDSALAAICKKMKIDART